MSEATNLKLNLAKGVVMNLAKSSGIENQKAKVVLCLDYSASMSTLYATGFVQTVLERIVPIAMAFDDDGAMDVYIFQHEAYRVQPDATVDNIHNYIREYITRKYSFGSTAYAPPINMIVKQFTKDNDADVSEPVSFGSKIKSFFTGTPSTTKPNKQVTVGLPTYVIFITDGENDPDDKAPAQKAITEAAKHGIFFQFVGLKSSSSTNFSFLTKLDKMPGRFIDNANFFEIRDNEITLDPNNPQAYLKDEDFYARLLTEYPSWTKEAIVKGLIEAPKALTTV